MRDRLQRFMMGRYGVDDLEKFLLGLLLGLMVLNLFVQSGILSAVTFGLLVCSYFRMFSRNIQARYQENVKYLEIKRKVTGFFKLKKKHAGDLRTHHIYKCPSCGQKIRVPRGRGRIVITCPKCRQEFEKKS